MERLFIYLMRRDGRSVIPVATLEGACPPRRITDVAVLRLPAAQQQTIDDVIHSHRMDYQAWMESAATYNALLAKLAKRGHRVISEVTIPLVNLAEMQPQPPGTLHHIPGSRPVRVNDAALKKLR